MRRFVLLSSALIFSAAIPSAPVFAEGYRKVKKLSFVVSPGDRTREVKAAAEKLYDLLRWKRYEELYDYLPLRYRPDMSREDFAAGHILCKMGRSCRMDRSCCRLLRLPGGCLLG